VSNIKTVSIIGRGDFGQLIAELLPEGIQHVNYGRQATRENINTIGSSDVIVLSIPLESYPEVLELLAPELNPESLVIDVCSVKVKPAELLKKHLPGHKNILLTHPLFGPQSIHNGQQHVLVVTDKTDNLDEKASEVLHFCERDLKLKLIHMTNEEHDERMAKVHALTFFIARALGRMDLGAEPFMTPSFQELLDLVRLDASQTNALFHTIENGNPFAAAERQRFLRELQEVNTELAD
jgi:prephenate dehydrogenase